MVVYSLCKVASVSTGRYRTRKRLLTSSEGGYYLHRSSPNSDPVKFDSCYTSANVAERIRQSSESELRPVLVTTVHTYWLWGIPVMIQMEQMKINKQSSTVSDCGQVITAFTISSLGNFEATNPRRHIHFLAQQGETRVVGSGSTSQNRTSIDCLYISN